MFVLGTATGWRIWPEDTIGESGVAVATWKWSAYGPLGTKEGIATSSDSALEQAQNAEQQLTR